MKRYNTTDLDDGERKFELEAAFGTDADVIELEPDDLVKPDPTEYPMADLLSVGDWVTIQHRAGNVTTGPVTEVKSYGFTIAPKNRTTAGFFGYDGFGGKYGTRNELIDVNGEAVDVEYEAQPVEN